MKNDIYEGVLDIWKMIQAKFWTKLVLAYARESTYESENRSVRESVWINEKFIWWSKYI